MAKLVLFNGPPRAGKDTAGAFAMLEFGAEPIKFSAALKDMTHRFFGYVGIPHNAFEETKDVPHPKFYGMTPRQAYIWMSEDVCKPKFGKSFFGEILAVKLKNQLHGNPLKRNTPFCATDCGFAEEVVPVVEVIGPQNCLLVRVIAAGCTYAGDSRRDLSPHDLPDGVAYAEVHNDKTNLAKYQADVNHAVRTFLQKGL